MLLGHIGGMILTLSSIPQIVKMIRTKSARDISFLFLLLLFLGRFCWLCHGYTRGDRALQIWNMIGIALTFILLVLKVKYDNSNQIWKDPLIEQSLDPNIVNQHSPLS